MRVPGDRISFLFNRYYKGEATAGETSELMALIRKSDQDEELAALIKNAWDQLEDSPAVFTSGTSDRILEKILSPAREDDTVTPLYESNPLRRERAPVLWWRYTAAAVLLLACIAGALWKRNDGNTLLSVGDPVPVTVLKPGSDKALLTLSDGQVISLGEAKQGFNIREGAVRITKVADGRLSCTPAEGGNGAGGITTLSTSRGGGQYRIDLPDGSRAWLNAASSIQFPAGFALEERKVEVNGEVYFEVAKDLKRPFRVIFGNNRVEVLGTSFNISHYDDEMYSNTTLVEGAVRLTSGDKVSLMRPGQKAEIAKDGSVQLFVADIEEVKAWKEGLFYFRDASLEIVMRQVARWYDLEVNYKGVLPEKKFNGKVPRNVSFTELMEMLGFAGVNYRLEGRKITILQ